MRTKTKKVSIDNKVAWGPEPKWTTKPLNENDSEIRLAFNWYSVMSNPSEQKRWTLEYLKQNSSPTTFIKAVSHIRDQDLKPLGSICRMALRGAQLPQTMLDRVQTRLQECVAKLSTTKPAKVKVKCEAKPMESEVELAVQKIEAIVTQIETGKIKFIGDKELSWARSLTRSQLQFIADYYKTTFSELKIAVSGEDPYVTECYSFVRKPHLVVWLEFMTRISRLKPAKTVTATTPLEPKKGRSKTVKPPSKIVSKVRFLPKDPETGIKSVAPEEIIGAAELWTYNTKLRKVGVYATNSTTGLTAKGTTVLNYDVRKSVTKTIRKPEKQIPELLFGGGRFMQKYFDCIKAVAQPITPRLNGETILLRVVRR